MSDRTELESGSHAAVAAGARSDGLVGRSRRSSESGDGDRTLVRRWATSLLTGMMRLLVLLWTAPLSAGAAQVAAEPDYSISAVRYATIPQFPVAALVRGADPDERLDIAMVFWVIRGDERIVLFDTGFYRDRWFRRFDLSDFMRPDSALGAAGFDPDSVTDLIVSHAHWDHMGGIALFPHATIWIQRAEYVHYTGEAWQGNGSGGGSDPDDLVELVRRNTQGRVHLIDGDDVEILPGIRVYTGARHTFASQFVRVAGAAPVVLASDNAYLYRNLTAMRPGATFTPADSTANLRALRRMQVLAGSPERVVPGHDPLQFERYPGTPRVVRIR